MSVGCGELGALIDEAVSYNCGPVANIILTRVMDRDWIAEKVASAAVVIASALKAGQTVWTFGNGGSAAQAQHFAAELTIGFRYPPPSGLRAVCLSADATCLTAAANDLAPDMLFTRVLCACAQSKDVALGITTSHSRNVLNALSDAEALLGVVPVLLVGRASVLGRRFANRDSICGPQVLDVVPPGAQGSYEAAQIQVGHLIVLHVLAHLIEQLIR